MEKRWFMAYLLASQTHNKNHHPRTSLYSFHSFFRTQSLSLVLECTDQSLPFFPLFSSLWPSFFLSSCGTVTVALAVALFPEPSVAE